MKTLRNSTAWLGLALAFGTLAFVLTTQAGKPPKPPPTPSGPAYNCFPLGGLGGSSGAGDINASGLVVGAASLGAGGETRPILVVPSVGQNGSPTWYKDADGDGRNDLMVDLGIPPGAPSNSSFYGSQINDDGVILGFHNASDDREFTWILAPQMIGTELSWSALDANGTNSRIALLPVEMTPRPEMAVWGQGLNNHGAVALVVELDNWDVEYWQRGFLLIPSRYEVSGGAVTIEYPSADENGDGLNDYLIDLGNGIDTRGRVRPLICKAINDQGDVAGGVWGGWLASVSEGRPFVLRPNNIMVGGSPVQIWNKDDNGDGINDLVVYLPVPDGVTQAEVTGMNESGAVVGTVSDRWGMKAALWQVDWLTKTATFKDLGLVAGEKNSSAQAVNASKQAVGYGVTSWSKPDYGASYKGWLWSQGTMYDLATLLLNGTGWTLLSANDINNRGIIVGRGNLNGLQQGFVAVPVTQP